MPSFLIVGAGCVGAVLGHHLTKGGAKVTFMVKPSQVSSFDPNVYPFRMKKVSVFRTSSDVETFNAYTLVDSAKEAAKEVKANGLYDAIVITLSSSAIRANNGDWCRRIGGLAKSIVCISPGPDDHRYLSERIGSELVCNGAILFAAYPTPLYAPVRTNIEYTTVGLALVIHGPYNATQMLSESLDKGGLCCKGTNYLGSPHYGSSLMMPLLAALELNSWSFKGTLFRLDTLILAARSCVEGFELYSGLPSMMFFLLYPFVCTVVLVMYCMLLLFGPILAPFDLEKMFKYHFTKCRDQTILLLDGVIREGNERSSCTQRLRSKLK
eukprot:CFRG7163T1